MHFPNAFMNISPTVLGLKPICKAEKNSPEDYLKPTKTVQITPKDCFHQCLQILLSDGQKGGWQDLQEHDSLVISSEKPKKEGKHSEFC